MYESLLLSGVGILIDGIVTISVVANNQCVVYISVESALRMSQVLILFVLVSLPKIRLTHSSLSLFTFYSEVFLSHGLLLQQMDTTSLPYLMVNRISQLLIMEDQSWTIVRLCFGKTPNQCLERRIDEERKSFTRVSLVYMI